MKDNPREPNPDVNTYIPSGDDPGGDDPNAPERDDYSSADVERKRDDEVIPVSPDPQPRQPIEEPPSHDDAPIGDVDDSPKRFADQL